jgi:hypothetical protein
MVARSCVLSDHEHSWLHEQQHDHVHIMLRHERREYIHRIRVQRFAF